jgi:hypothetical protein
MYLYRYLGKLEWAEALVSGHVWISTLEICRRYEHRKRGDPGEGNLSYHQTTFVGSTTHPSFKTLAARARIEVNGTGNVGMHHNRVHTRLPDAWVLCLTDRDEPEIARDFAADDGTAPHVVRIDDPPRFYRVVTAAMARYPVSQTYFSPVDYRVRSYKDLEPAPVFLGFVKPPMYAHQREVRMLWIPPARMSIEPIVVDIPDVGRLCTLIR